MFAKLFELRDKKLKDNKKKGFTLVELIVVLVIIAILAALLIPALTGYINKAKEKSITAETRQAVMAAQTLVDEEYGKLDLTAAANAITIGESKTGENASTITYGDIAKLAEVPEANITAVTVYDGKVISLTYESQNKTCIYSVKNAGTADKPDYASSKGTYEVK